MDNNHLHTSSRILRLLVAWDNKSEFGDCMQIGIIGVGRLGAQLVGSGGNIAFGRRVAKY